MTPELEPAMIHLPVTWTSARTAGPVLLSKTAVKIQILLERPFLLGRFLF
jgi:hypothetical protein